MFLSFLSSGRKRRGSETFSDSSGDEFFTGFKDISPQTSTSAAGINTNPASGVTITKSTSQAARSTSHNGRSLIINRSERGAGESEECTAALVLMNLSHSPGSASGLAFHLTDQNHHHHHDKVTVSHQGHVRCLPGGACLVGEPASKMHPDHNKQVQGEFSKQHLHHISK